MDIRKNYAFWCDKDDVKDVCNRVYDLLDKDVVDAKSNTMIVFKNNDCWFFLDIELDGLVCITDFFDASFVAAVRYEFLRAGLKGVWGETPVTDISFKK